MLTNKDTGKPHTATWSMIIGGIVAIVCIAGVAWGNFPKESLATVIAPLISLITLAKRG